MNRLQAVSIPGHHTNLGNVNLRRQVVRRLVNKVVYFNPYIPIFILAFAYSSNYGQKQIVDVPIRYLIFLRFSYGKINTFKIVCKLAN